MGKYLRIMGLMSGVILKQTKSLRKLYLQKKDIQ